MDEMESHVAMLPIDPMGSAKKCVLTLVKGVQRCVFKKVWYEIEAESEAAQELRRGNPKRVPKAQDLQDMDLDQFLI